jgi:AcrR family transcriptional regulator
MKHMNGRQRRKAKPSPRRREQQVRRQAEILKAAFEVFAAKGFEAARIDDVAQRAGIAKGTIYLYFPDKERLFQAVVRNLIPRRFDLLVKSLPGPPTELVQALLSQMYLNIVRNEKVRPIARMLVAESARFPQLADIYHREIIAPGMRAMREALRKGRASGEFRKTRALEFPQLVVAPALVAMLWKLLFADRHPLDLDAYMKAHMEFVLGGLEKPRGQRRK